MPSLIDWLPQRLLNFIADRLANSTLVWLKNCLIRYFLWQYTVNLEEAIQTDPYQYKSFNDFFTRALKPEARPIVLSNDQLISPVDGYIGQIGTIEHGSLIQAKGHSYSVVDLLGGDQNEASSFQSGTFSTLYLAPHNYHRVHMPIDGALTKMIYIPGKLFPVNPKSVQRTPNLFARNERVITFFDTPQGRMAVILVGAMIVGSIETVWAGTITSSEAKPCHWDYHPTIHFKQSEEIGRFKLGSTVIVLLESPVQWNASLDVSQPIQMGQPISVKLERS